MTCFAGRLWCPRLDLGQDETPKAVRLADCQLCRTVRLRPVKDEQEELTLDRRMRSSISITVDIQHSQSLWSPPIFSNSYLEKKGTSISTCLLFQVLGDSVQRGSLLFLIHTLLLPLYQTFLRHFFVNLAPPT